jgi:ribosomal protein S12 methylthiotransferase accessory factor
MTPPPAGLSLQLIPLDFRSNQVHELSDAARHLAGDWILSAPKRFERIFVLRSRIAPGLAFVGAQASVYPFDVVTPSPTRLSAGGTGVSLVEALISCMGEGLEFLSQVEREGDATHSGTVDDVRSLLDPDIAAWLAEYQPELLGASGRRVDWLMATSADGRRTTLIPADLCLRRSDNRRVLPLRGPLSTGCAVGPSREEAATRAILELVERDAVALWWLGGCPGRPVLPSGMIATEAAALLGRLRDGQAARVAWLLDITTDLGVPTFAALSADGNGRQLACGFAARTAASEAARAAILEMTQVETAFALIELKLAEGGPAALDQTDQRHLRRGALDVGACGLLHPSGPPAGWPEGEPQGRTALAALLQRLRDRGVGVWLADLTRAEHGVDAIRALAPELQPFPSTYRSQRLLSVVANCGGGNQYAEGVDIM